MIGNKISFFRYILPVLLLGFAASAQSFAVETEGYFSVTKFNLDSSMTPEEHEAEKKRNSPLNPDLMYRVAFGRAGDVAELLKQGADASTRNATGHSALVTAIIRKDDEAEPIVRALLQYGANPNEAGPDSTYPVVEVVKSGRADVLQALIDYRAVLTYAKDERGRDLLTLAEGRGDQSILAVLKPALEIEKQQLETLKSPENFIKMIQEYAFLNCANEYLNYFMSTSPEGVDINKFSIIVNQNYQEINHSSRRIKFSFNITDKELYKINYTARKNIVTKLRSYKTNHNRKINGIGTDKDLNNRCWKIAKSWNSRNINKKAYELYIR